MDNPYHTRESAAGYLGTSTRSIDRWAVSGRLPVYRLGANKRFKQSDLDRLVSDASPTPRPARFGRAVAVA